MPKPTRPGRQLCQLCGTEDEVELRSDGPDIWTFVCSREYRDHPYEWTPTATVSFVSGRTGIGEELGVYDALLDCIEPGEWLEYGVIEYRFAQAEPAAYQQLLSNYGHTSLGPTRYSVSSFLSHALSQLQREGLTQYAWSKATGYWSYLSRVSAWALPGTPEGDVTSWSTFSATAGCSEDDWPPTGYKA